MDSYIPIISFDDSLAEEKQILASDTVRISANGSLQTCGGHTVADLTMKWSYTQSDDKNDTKLVNALDHMQST